MVNPLQLPKPCRGGHALSLSLRSAHLSSVPGCAESALGRWFIRSTDCPAMNRKNGRISYDIISDSKFRCSKLFGLWCFYSFKGHWNTIGTWNTSWIGHWQLVKDHLRSLGYGVFFRARPGMVQPEMAKTCGKAVEKLVAFQFQFALFFLIRKDQNSITVCRVLESLQSSASAVEPSSCWCLIQACHSQRPRPTRLYTSSIHHLYII